MILSLMFARCRMASRTGSQWRSNQPRVVRTGSLRTQSARHRVDHGTICGRSCANSGHCKPLCACVDRTKFVAPASVGGPEFFCGVCADAENQQKGLALQRHFEGEARQFVRRSYLNRAAVRLGDLGRNVEAETEALLARSYLSTDERVE